MIAITPDPFIASIRTALPLAILFFAGGSHLIEELIAEAALQNYEIDDHKTRPKEIFYSWLLVFFNAYIGIFIANRAIKSDSSAFFAWGLLGNGVRAGIFLILLLLIVEWAIFNVRGFVLTTFFGYFTFLAVEIYGLQCHTHRPSVNPQSNQEDE